MKKSEIRKNILPLRKELSEPLLTLASTAITDAILELDDYKNAKKIALYMAINNEVNLEKLWNHACYNHKACYFPKVTAEHMHFLPGDNIDQFIANKWGILEPSSNLQDAININDLDIIILPLVAFDCTGNRVGMGKGYYDKTLKSSKHPTLVGVAYEFQKITKINAETWDIKLDIIATENAIYYTHG